MDKKVMPLQEVMKNDRVKSAYKPRTSSSSNPKDTLLEILVALGGRETGHYCATLKK